MSDILKKPGISLLLVGATGAVGSRVLQAALADPRIWHVVAPTRRPLPEQPGLEAPVVDFSALPGDAHWWQVDAVICALGTTIRTAGSQAAFAAIDRDLPITVARLARAAGATRCALNSSLGASARGNFYLRTKAEAEAGIGALGYPIYTIVRPSLIDTERAEPRTGERIGLALARALRPLIPRRYRAVSAERIAHALIEGVLRDDPGQLIVESDEITTV